MEEIAPYVNTSKKVPDVQGIFNIDNLFKKLDEKCQVERMEDYNKLVDLIERR